jgi:hypothetical protein
MPITGIHPHAFPAVMALDVQPSYTGRPSGPLTSRRVNALCRVSLSQSSWQEPLPFLLGLVPAKPLSSQQNYLKKEPRPVTAAFH